MERRVIYVLIWKNYVFIVLIIPFQKRGISFYLFRPDFMTAHKMLQLRFHFGAVPFLVNLFSDILQRHSHYEVLLALLPHFSSRR